MGERLGKGTDADRPWANRGRELGWPRKDWTNRKCWRCFRQNRGGWWFQTGSPITWKSGMPPQNVVARFLSLQMVQSNYFDPLEDAIVCKWCISTRLWLFQSGVKFEVAMGTLRFRPMISMSRVVLSRNGGTMPYVDTGLIWTYNKKKVSVYRF